MNHFHYSTILIRIGSLDNLVHKYSGLQPSINQKWLLQVMINGVGFVGHIDSNTVY